MNQKSKQSNMPAKKGMNPMRLASQVRALKQQLADTKGHVASAPADPPTYNQSPTLVLKTRHYSAGDVAAVGLHTLAPAGNAYKARKITVWGDEETRTISMRLIDGATESANGVNIVATDRSGKLGLARTAIVPPQDDWWTTSPVAGEGELRLTVTSDKPENALTIDIVWELKVELPITNLPASLASGAPPLA